MARHDIVVAGHLCLDLTPKFPDTGARQLSDIMVPGTLVVVGECVVSTGGAVANAGLALVKLGVKALLVGKVGDDSFGRIVVGLLERYGAAEGLRIVPGEQTSYSIVVAPPNVDRMFLHNPGANNTFCAADVPREALEQTRAFHLGYPPLMGLLYADEGAEMVEIFRCARELGATTSLDMAMPDPDSPAGKVDWDAVFRRVLPLVDLFLPSAEEVLYCLEPDAFLGLRQRAHETGRSLLDLLTPQDCSRLAARLIDYGAGVVALKAGQRGIYARTAGTERLGKFGRARVGDVADWAGRELWEPAYRVESVASATGAGDCAVAAFLAAFLRGESIELALRMATAAGALNVRVHDAVSGLRSYEETRDLLSQLEKAEPGLNSPEWPCDDTGIRHGPADRR